MHQTALKAYDTVNRNTMNGREVEAEVLTRAALKLRKCRDKLARDGQQGAILADALRYNQRVWAVFQAELEKPENLLPDALKAGLFKLIVFIDRRTLELLANPEPEKLTILININHNIAAGLRMKVSGAEAAKAAA